MSTVVKFQGKDYIEPGSYAATVYNPTSNNVAAAFGNCMIIDTGLSKNGTYEFAGGSGIAGENAKGLKSVYEFNSIEDFAAFMGGGQVVDIASKLFTPLNGVNGIPKLYYVRAATTVAATITLTIGAATLILKCKDEGIVGNGIKVSDVLKVGYSGKIIKTGGTSSLQISKGTFQGVDPDGESYGTYSIEKSLPKIMTSSPALTTFGALYDWCLKDKFINSKFTVSLTGTGARAVSLDTVAETLAVGGTTTFLDTDNYDDVLEAISELDVTFHLCTKGGTDGTDAATNVKLFGFIKQDAKFSEFQIIPGGSDDTDLFGDAGTSEAIAKYFDSANVITIHGAAEDVRKDNNGTKVLPPIYLAATIIGLNAGMAPQTPLTFKKVGYKNFVYPLKKKEREKALQLGIMHVRNVSGNWCINQGITTLQDNLKMIAEDGQSLELSIELIKAQLNKELILKGQIKFTGTTAAQSDPETIKNFTETYLASRVAKKGADDLIISWKNVKVKAENGDWMITYDFVPNVPVNKTFFVGNMLDFTF